MTTYTAPKIEIIKLDEEDVITTSGGFSALFTESVSYGSDRGVNLTSYRID